MTELGVPPGLSRTEQREFAERGFLFPLPVLDPAEVAEHGARMRSFGAARGGSLPPAFNLKPHLLFPALWDLVHDARILGPVADLLGPDILCWASSFFDKDPGSAEHVAWHQDATYWGLARPDAVTAWVAFTSSDRENGCLQVIPGSHRSQLRHVDSGDAANMLAGRETIGEAFDRSGAVAIELRPGEMSLHHLMLVHGSAVNRSDRRRSGFAIRYVAAATPQVREPRGTATLVRGRDHGTFDLEQAPARDLDPAALRRHGAIARRSMEIVLDEIRRDRDRAAHTPA